MSSFHNDIEIIIILYYKKMLQYKCKYKYELPQSFIDSILLLQSIVIVPPVDDINNKKGTKNHKQVVNIWSKEPIISIKTPQTSRLIAKSNKKSETEKDIDDIRMALNMISTKNYESQKNIVIEHVRTNNSETKVAQFIFDIASSNKFYVELYVDLYTELISESNIFQDILNNHLSLFVDTINNIKQIDPSVDYDKYCQYVTENDKRRALLTFYMHLSKKKITDPDKIFDIIFLFQSAFLEFIEKDDKTAECDEIAEMISIFIHIGKNVDFFVSNSRWYKIIENIGVASKFKAKSYKSLSNRTVFKYLDMIESIV
jgi:hypothetical protein